MAYYLQWPASSGWVATPDWVPPDVDNWSFEIEIQTPSTTNGDKTIAGREDGSGQRTWKLFIKDGQLGILHNSSWTVGGIISTPVLPNSRIVVKGEFNADTIRLYVDDNLKASASGRDLNITAGGSHLSAFGRSIVSNTSNITDLVLYRAKFWSDAAQTALALDYDPSASNGTGSILPDTVGGNDGTLVNFPTDDSQWVFYSDATGVTADAAYTINAPTFASSASVTLPQPVADGAFSIASPTFSADATATLPQPIADAAFTINAPTFAVTASATIPGFNASVSFAIPAPTFTADAAVTLPSPTAGIGYTIAAPTFSVNAEATLPQPSSDVAFTVNSPTFAATATATEPGFNASVNFTVNAPTFSANASATLPQPNADVGFTVSAPTFSVVAIVGGIAIIVDNETNINVPALATNINAPVQSNNVRI